MKEIKLTRGMVTLVDDADFEWLNAKKWCVLDGGSTFYATRCKGITMHRLILNVDDPKMCVDHIDHNGLNNQRYNLRVCTKGQNCANRQKYKNKSSIFLGVCRKGKIWTTSLTSKQKTIFLGHYKNEIDAAKAYNKAAKKYHGEFASLNKIK